MYQRPGPWEKEDLSHRKKVGKKKTHLYEQGLCHSFNLKNNSNENSSSEMEKVREEDLNGV